MRRKMRSPRRLAVLRIPRQEGKRVARRKSLLLPVAAARKKPVETLLPLAPPKTCVVVCNIWRITTGLETGRRITMGLVTGARRPSAAPLPIETAIETLRWRS